MLRNSSLMWPRPRHEPGQVLTGRGRDESETCQLARSADKSQRPRMTPVNNCFAQFSLLKEEIMTVVTRYTEEADSAAARSDYDPYTDAALLDPWQGYKELRDAAPAVWLTKYGMFALTRYGRYS